MVLVAVSFVLITFWVNLKTGVNGPALAVVGAFFAGLLAQNYGPWTNSTVTIVLTPTMFFSVPGGLLAKDAGLLDFATGGTVLIDLLTILAVIEGSVGIWVGLGLASLFTNPLAKKSHCVCGEKI